MEKIKILEKITKKIKIINYTEGLEIIEPCIVINMPNEVYHKISAINSSTLSKFWHNSPALWKWEQENPIDFNPNFDIGSAAHNYILENAKDFDKIFKVFDFATWGSKAAKEALEKNLSLGYKCLLAKDFEAIQGMSKSIKLHDFAMNCFKTGLSELSLFWYHPVTKKMCKARPDFISFEEEFGETIVTFSDYKTTTDSSLNGFAKKVYNYGYNMQAAWYKSGIEQLFSFYSLNIPKILFYWVAQEKKPPYLVNVLVPNVMDIESGFSQNEWALELYLKCLNSGEYPHFVNEKMECEAMVCNMPVYAIFEINQRLGFDR